MAPGWVLLTVILLGLPILGRLPAFRRRWGDVRAAIEARTVPKRFIAPTGERDFDTWVVEGLSAYGSNRTNLVAGAITGMALPWTLALLAFAYAWINNSFAPPWARVDYGVDRALSLLVLYGGLLVRSTLVCAAIGSFFAYVRRELILGRLSSRTVRWGALRSALDSRLFATATGWAVYAAWALWPRGPEGSANYSGALQHPWLWIFFGILFSAYLHWGHATLLYRFYLWHWDEAVRAIARRLLAGRLEVWEECPITADTDTGRVEVSGFPRGRGVGRLKDLLWRIPGVTRLSVEEAGDAASDDVELITLHISDEVRDASVGALIKLGNLVYRIGFASGFIVYGAGLAYVFGSGTFFQAAGWVVVVAIQVEIVGWPLGFLLRTLICRRAQRRLPAELERNLAFYGKTISGFRYGFSWKECVVEADLSREEARRYLATVAARFGIERLLVLAPKQSIPVDPATEALLRHARRA